ncbi:MAG: T9SS C-terminal target domain-containing protein [Ignavibacteriales bacterium]|nr:MAG: T9SS C-terminal target domain-containing protein [Ignavibacteriales bacterium]
MNKTLVTLFFLLVTLTITGQNYKKVKYYFNDSNDLKRISLFGVAVDDGKIDVKEKSLTMFISDDEFRKLSQLNLKNEIIIDDWFKEYKKLSTQDFVDEKLELKKSREIYGVKSFGYGSMGGFYTLQEILNKLDTMFLNYPNIITQKFQIGTTVENRPIYVIKISDNPNVNEDEPEVFFSALTHAREPESMMVLMYYMYYLLENYGTDPEVTYLVDNRQIYFVPVVNPDGYEYNRITNPSGGGMYRKNKRSPNGIDLNRNFGYKWGYDNTGSSNIPADETYRGASAFSEPETQAIRDFCLVHNFKTALNYHTYGNLLIFPWGYVNQETADSSYFREFAGDMTKFNNYTWGTSGGVLYNTNGDVDDWMYGEQTAKSKVLSMTPEVGSTGFWPVKSLIFPLAEENLKPNLYLTWVADGYVSLKSYSLSQQYFNPGDEAQLTVKIKNKGLANSDNISVQLKALSEDVSVTNTTQNVNQIGSGEEFSLETPFSFSISQNISSVKKVNLLLAVYNGSVPMAADTISFTIGTPQYFFNDTTDNLTTLWNANTWAATTSVYYSAPNCYTDSKNGLYANNANNSITLKNEIDLNQAHNPTLSFYTKFDIESQWDYGQVKFSTNNGSSWFSLPGKYNHLGTGSFQPNNEYLYDGKKDEWIREEIDLSSLSGKKIKMRFEFHSDSYEQRDGWYVDDIEIYQYMILPVELSSFTVAAGENSVLLNWSTASEINNQGFFIQRSPDKLNWNNLQFINGKGTTSNYSDYQYVDRSPLNGKSYYRLIQQDLDGTQKILKSIEVNFTVKIKFSLEQNYPNPFNPVTVIKYSIPNSNSENGMKVQLKVYDLLGNEVAVLVNGFNQPGNYSVKFSAQQLPSGIYIYQLKAGEFLTSRKMTLIK